MPIEFDGPNSKVSADTIAGQGGSTITIQSGHSLSGSGASLTALNATQLTSGTVPDARFPATLPAASGANLTALNATNLGSGIVPTARLGTGTPNNTVFLRGDSSWQTVTTTALTGSTNTWIPTITGANALTGTANFTYDGNTLDVKNSGTASSINLYCETSNAHYIKIKSGPHSGATNYTLTLPNTPPSANGHALTATTAGVASWAAAGGGFKFLAHTRVLHTSGGSAVSAIEFDASDGIDNNTYAGYLFHCTRMFPGNNGRVGMRVSDDNGSTWKASGYKCHLHSIDEDGLQQVGTSSSENTIRFCTNSNGNSAGFFGHCQIYIPVETLSHEYGYANIQGGWREDASSYDSYACYGSGAQTSGSAAGGWDAFQFLAESGNIAANITMYGMVKA